ncbi:hypothetical protein E2C01_020434 [Portunus trituberculatus]|uniref:Uncharacterized protein n=1 Tax=Portunus trituberculatus TaxID=210409 RepID=A0A5B7E2A0_PORTR|nr:hypothetical protein [Portunus trituberculatus]
MVPEGPPTFSYFDSTFPPISAVRGRLCAAWSPKREARGGTRRHFAASPLFPREASTDQTRIGFIGPSVMTGCG